MFLWVPQDVKKKGFSVQIEGWLFKAEFIQNIGDLWRFKLGSI